MSKSAQEVLTRGMQCLQDQLGAVDAEYFISLIIREQFDYTQWQREYFDQMTPEEISREAADYNKKHPFSGKAATMI